MDHLKMLMRFVGNNCYVTDTSLNEQEKDKVFSVTRKCKNYKFDINFEKLIKNGFIPYYMDSYNNKDEIIFRYIKEDK